MRPANDNQEKLPNIWWPLPVFIVAFVALIIVTAIRAYGGETVEVKYRGQVELTPFECEDVTRSSFIRRVCYDECNQYMIIRLKRTYYHYCEIDAVTVSTLKADHPDGATYGQS